MIRSSLFAALAAVAATTAATAMPYPITPFPGGISRIQDNADQALVLTGGASRGFAVGQRQVFGAPQSLRGSFAEQTGNLDGSSIRRNFGTSSDHFQDNADAVH